VQNEINGLIKSVVHTEHKNPKKNDLLTRMVRACCKFAGMPKYTLTVQLHLSEIEMLQRIKT